MLTWLQRDSLNFPPLHRALREPNGLLAAGGDLSPERLIQAYRHGCFPWFQDGQPILWWSPDPRCVFLTDAYRPGGRAINYRSEPFGIDQMHLQHEYFGFEDESMGYSSYTFGDPSPTIPRSYIGDPAKFRLVHGGSEVFHSHHPHGGTIRWPRSPRAIASAADDFQRTRPAATSATLTANMIQAVRFTRGSSSQSPLRNDSIISPPLGQED